MSFETAVEFVLEHEGGYSNDPRDPGGETKFGISRRAYPLEDIKGLTIERARELYLRDYWMAAGCERISDPAMAFLVFDCAVNQGVARAKSFLASSPTPAGYQTARAVHYAGLPSFPIYGRGWMRRLFDGLQRALA